MTGKKVNSEILLTFKDNPDPGRVTDTISGFSGYFPAREGKTTGNFIC
jgi:hypothetical protein